MTALAALVQAYEELQKSGLVANFGFSAEKIRFVIYLDRDGKPVGLPVDLQRGDTTAKPAAIMRVPQPVKRTSGIAPNFLWDKTSYVLGVPFDGNPRTRLEHQSFVDLHCTWLVHAEDEGLTALANFLARWRPEMFLELNWPEQMRGENIAFAFASDAGKYSFIHEREAALELWQTRRESGHGTVGCCLATGNRHPIARLHPVIKGVMGAQTSGASIVSFNLDAFCSYGRQQGDNAPVSKKAAFAYTTALNHFLARSSGNRIQIGDTTVVFWAAPRTKRGPLSPENVFSHLLGRDEQSEKIDADELTLAARAYNAVDRCSEPNERDFFVVGLVPNVRRPPQLFGARDGLGDLPELDAPECGHQM